MYNKRKEKNNMKKWLYKYQIDNLDSQVEKLNKKADKLGVPHITVEETGRYKSRVAKIYKNAFGEYFRKKPVDRYHSKEVFEELDMKTALVEVEIKGELPVVSGHVVVAEIEHTRSEDGTYENIVTPFAFGNENQELISNMVFNTFKNHAPDCEHCKMNRRRNKTFAVLNEDTMQVSQIASKCLEDYVPKMTLGSALFGSESSKLFSEIDTDSEYGGSVYPSEWFFETKLIVALAAYATKNHGFQSAKTMEPTKDFVLDVFRKPKSVPDEMREIVYDFSEGRSNKWIDEAQKTIDHIISSSSNDPYIHNLKVVLKSDFVQAKGARWGLLNSAPNSYFNSQLDDIELNNEHFMQEKERGLIKFKVIKVKESGIYDEYVNNFLTLVTDKGHKLHFKQYFPSSLEKLEVDKTYIAKATVKSHHVNKHGENVSYLARMAELEEVAPETPEPDFKPAKKKRVKKKAATSGLEM